MMTRIFTFRSLNLPCNSSSTNGYIQINEDDEAFKDALECSKWIEANSTSPLRRQCNQLLFELLKQRLPPTAQ